MKLESCAVGPTIATYHRGTELLMGAMDWLDLTSRGRNESKGTVSWVRLHDEYRGWRPYASSMTYDLRFEGEPQPVGEVRAALVALLGNGTIHWSEGTDWLGVDVWYANDEGDAIDPPKARSGTFNRVDVHVPHGTSAKLVRFAVRVADRITQLTGWRAFDPQRDEYLDKFEHPWRAEVVPAAHRVESISVSDGLVRLKTAPYGPAPAAWTWTLATGALVAVPREETKGFVPGNEAWSHEAKLVACFDGKRIAISKQSGGRPTARIERCGAVRALAFSPGGALLASGADTPSIRIWTREGKPHTRLAAPGRPRIWEGVRGRLLTDAKESLRRVTAISFIDEKRLVGAFADGRVCLYALPNKTALVWLALLEGGAWVVMTPDGAWDASPGVDAVQWSWVTDARYYRDAMALDSSKRRSGLLASFA